MIYIHAADRREEDTQEGARRRIHPHLPRSGSSPPATRSRRPPMSCQRNTGFRPAVESHPQPFVADAPIGSVLDRRAPETSARGGQPPGPGIAPHDAQRSPGRPHMGSVRSAGLTPHLRAPGDVAWFVLITAPPSRRLSDKLGRLPQGMRSSYDVAPGPNIHLSGLLLSPRGKVFLTSCGT